MDVMCLLLFWILLSLTNVEITAEEKDACCCVRDSSPKFNTNIHTELKTFHRINLTLAIRDIVRGLPTNHVSLLFDRFLDSSFPEILSKVLHNVGVTTGIFLTDTKKNQEKFFQYTRKAMKEYTDSVNIIFASKSHTEDLLDTIQENNLIHRKLLYILYWGRQYVNLNYVNNYEEAMRIAVISNPRPGIIYYSQADTSEENNLKMVNWWSKGSGLFRNPVLPSTENVFKNFYGREFLIPVLHKPPWHFVIYNNDSSFEKVDGGRDDQLINVIAQKLNFRYAYIDPVERAQGSAFNENGTFPGAIGMIWSREADFFLGDVTITLERSLAVEFSFLILVDSEVFVTHRPSKLNEALALVRPFHWQVWPLIISVIILYGPILFGIIEAPALWRGSLKTKEERKKLLSDCFWFSTSTFLRQSGKQPERSHKVRLVLILMTLGATYVIGDMYSANLTSLLARPGREKPISNLGQLEFAMEFRGYELLVEKHSSSFNTLANGSGIYERVWKKMQKQQQSIIESMEQGMKLVRKKLNLAIIGGRETLYFDTRRFGANNYYISEKLNTKYSAIAMQQGCPYIENFNKIIMQLFESGILTKMTEEEYEILNEKLRAAAGFGKSDEAIAEAKRDIAKQGESMDATGGSEKVHEGDVKTENTIDNEHQMEPLSIRMLQGAFYLLIIGYFVAGMVLIIEMNYLKLKKMSCLNKIKFRKESCRKWLGKMKKKIIENNISYYN